MLLYIKIFFMLLAGIFTIYSLVKLSKRKTHFQLYPDSIKKEYLKEVRISTILNFISVVLILSSYFFLQSYLFFFPILFAMLLTAHSLSQLYEDFDDFKE